MKKINPEYAQAIMKVANTGPYLRLLPMKIIELDYGYCKVETEITDKLYNPFGSVHGGVFSSVLDTATFWAFACCIEDGQGFTTIDLQVSHLAGIKEGKIIAEGKQVKIGRTICLAESTLKDEKGKLLAHGTSKILITNALQPLEQAVAKAGFGMLPPKFL
ncbi:MAG TPA: PaaI family thioesterase [Candidatus Avacidaminococcus intestinavium]|uniref:PaaI family thioesterase n=1 Tax=Candidatus Avacidaminococcus intestinavium TaxID=2840684 RepID=A0A9D1MP52_9FIRM|nr:PaaI family thioesterase [Candidatus Avacidaminococcus intestinavium]